MLCLISKVCINGIVVVYGVFDFVVFEEHGTEYIATDSFSVWPHVA